MVLARQRSLYVQRVRWRSLVTAMGIGVVVAGCELEPEEPPAFEPSQFRALPKKQPLELEPVPIEVDLPKLVKPPDRSKEDFVLDATEVTVAMYGYCVRKKQCQVPAQGPYCTYHQQSKDKHPVNCVRWDDARDYCEFGKKRLPTAAEWLWVARLDSDGRYFWGSDWPPPSGVGNLADGSLRTSHPSWRFIDGYYDGFVTTATVGSRSAIGTSGGIFNLVGNVAEWVDDAVPFAPGEPNPAGRIVLGASFGTWQADHMSFGYRRVYHKDHASMHVGFRCAKSKAPNH
jgi:formylglycine-generating enzyme required for sulfatase activity